MYCDSNRFHLAILAGDLESALEFYCGVLGCVKGNSGTDWVDINFWGNELSLHASDPSKKQIGKEHVVDMNDVSVPHFGVHLDTPTFQNIKKRLIENRVKFVSEPYTRFKDGVLEQETMFVADPIGNCLEIKTMKNPAALFDENRYLEDEMELTMPCRHAGYS